MLKKLWILSILLFSIPSANFIPLEFKVKPPGLIFTIIIFIALIFSRSKRLKYLKINTIIIIITFIFYITVSNLIFLYFNENLQINNFIKGFSSLICGVIYYIVFRAMNIDQSEKIHTEKIIIFSISISIYIAIVQFIIVNFIPDLIFIPNYINNLVNGSDLISESRFNGLSPEPAWLAGQIILFMLPLTLSMILSKETYGLISFFRYKSFIKIEYYYFLLSIIGVVISGSRTGIIGMIIIIFSALIFYNKSLKESLNYIKILSILLFIFLFIFLAFQNDYNFSLLNALDSSNSFEEFAGQSYFAPRASLAYASLDIFISHPFFGIGINQFALYYPDFIPDWALNEPEVVGWLSGNDVNPKNFILRLLSECGLFGFIIFFSFILSHFIKNKNLNTKYKILRTSIFFALLIFIFESDSFALPNIWFALGFLL